MEDTNGTPISFPANLIGDRRREPRTAALGCVTLSLHDGATARTMYGQLVDVSPSGFRLRHDNRELRVGQNVRASYHWGEVIVRVVWNRATNGHIESGFQILQNSSMEA